MEAKFSPMAVSIFLSSTTAAIVGFCLWFFSSTLFTNYTPYTIIFPKSIAGLYVGSSVTYNGVQVGNVVNVAIKEKFGNKVVATLNINNKIKIKEDTFATLNMKGITGQMFIELNGGSSESEIIQPNKHGLLIISYTESIFDQISTSAPMLLHKTGKLISRLEKLLSGQNKENINNMIKNISSISQEASKLPPIIHTAVIKLNKLMDAALPILNNTKEGLNNLPQLISDATEPIMPIVEDLREISKNVNQFTSKVNNQGITAILTSARSL